MEEQLGKLDQDVGASEWVKCRKRNPVRLVKKNDEI
jgi:hypothetical protein